MDLPTPPNAIATLASFLRDRLADVGLGRREDVGPALGSGERAVVATARQMATVIITAAGPFAPTSYARARLIRQLHATGLLSADEVVRAGLVLELDGSPPTIDMLAQSGAPR